MSECAKGEAVEKCPISGVKLSDGYAKQIGPIGELNPDMTWVTSKMKVYAYLQKVSRDQKPFGYRIS